MKSALYDEISVWSMIMGVEKNAIIVVRSEAVLESFRTVQLGTLDAIVGSYNIPYFSGGYVGFCSMAELTKDGDISRNPKSNF